MMSKSTQLGAFLVCLAVLLCAAAVPARAGSYAPVQAPSTVSSLTVPATLLPSIWWGTGKSGGDDGNEVDNDGDGDDAPAPVPEPSTLLSLGVALMIGGGVFFLGRLRKERK